MVEFINGMPAQRWMRLEAKNSGYTKEGSGANTVRTQDKISVVRRIERGSAASANSEAATAEQKMSAVEVALTSIRALLVNARDVATSSNVAGAFRSELTTEANYFISEANQIFKEASLNGKKLFDPENPDQKMRLAVGGGSAIAVGLSDVSTTPIPNVAKVEFSQVLGAGGSSDDVMMDIATAPDGTVYGTGWSAGNFGGVTNQGDEDAFVTKYSPSGSTIWTRMLGSTARDRGLSITTSSDGSVFVAGLTDGTIEGNVNDSRRVFVSKLNSDGSTAWTKLSGAVLPTNTDFKRVGLGASSDGFLYLGYSTSGSFDGQSASEVDLDSFLTKMNTSDGSTVWTSISGVAGEDRVTDLKVASDGSVYVVGEQNGRGYLGKFRNDGSTVFADVIQAMTVTPNRNQTITEVVIGSNGSVYTSGNFGYGDGKRVKYVEKYYADGSTAWTKEFDNTPIKGMTVGTDGAVYLTGESSETAVGQAAPGGKDVLVIKFNEDGSDGGRRTINLSGSDVGNAMTVGIDGSLYLGGETKTVGATSSDVVLMKFGLESRKSLRSFGSVDLTTATYADIAVSKLNDEIAAIDSRLRGVNLGITRSKAAQKYSSLMVDGLDAGIQATAPVTFAADEFSSIESTATERKRSIADINQTAKRGKQKLRGSLARG